MQGKTSKTRDGLLFETSWEVCNKIGGIYTVLSTKAAELHKLYGDKLIFVGPDVWSEENPSPSFLERKSLLKNLAKNVKLPFGLSIRVGRWNVPGKPITILVKFDSLDSEMNRIFGEMWENYGVDSLHANGDYRESCTFAVATAIVMQKVTEYLKVADSEVYTHFNEWTTGMGLLYIKTHAPKMATLFTTHATCIGRSICGNGKPLYDQFENYNGDQMAAELNMESKHSLEKIAAHQADCFTAVSDLTADECEQLLEIRPQVVTPNGFNSSMVPTRNLAAGKRKAAREKFLSVASALTGSTLDDNTLIVATSGRNEYRNKGLDLFIDAMNSLNRGSCGDLPKSVLALILVPAWTKQPSMELINALNAKDSRKVYPSFSTHRLNNEDYDPVFCRLKSVQQADADLSARTVKFMYVPCYLDGNDGVINLAYYDALLGVDLTVFASYYEPWGYTPLESIAFSVPTVTSNKSGFGQWIESEFKSGLMNSGVEVVERTDSNYDSASLNIAKCVAEYAAYTSKEECKAGKAANDTASAAEWQNFICYYRNAFEYADKAAAQRLKK